MRLAHISDLHWLDLQNVKAKDFLNKRLSGGLNLWLGGRAKKYLRSSTIAALECIASLNCDQILISGDLSNLALESEFKSLKSVLNQYFKDEHLSIVPGNHDYYTRESARERRFERIFYEKPPSDLSGLNGDSPWPFVRLIGELAIIGLNSAMPRPLFMASGSLGKAQCQALEHCLARPELQDRFIILMLHHHLLRAKKSPGERWRKLKEDKWLLNLCRDRQIPLICHGHNHIASLTRVEHSIIAEAGSVSASLEKRRDGQGKFFVYDFEGKRLSQIQQFGLTEGKFAKLRSIAPQDIAPHSSLEKA